MINQSAPCNRQKPAASHDLCSSCLKLFRRCEERERREVFGEPNVPTNSDSKESKNYGEFTEIQRLEGRYLGFSQPFRWSVHPLSIRTRRVNSVFA